MFVSEIRTKWPGWFPEINPGQVFRPSGIPPVRYSAVRYSAKVRYSTAAERRGINIGHGGRWRLPWATAATTLASSQERGPWSS